jgi:hypothetical protein
MVIDMIKRLEELEQTALPSDDPDEVRTSSQPNLYTIHVLQNN